MSTPNSDEGGPDSTSQTENRDDRSLFDEQPSHSEKPEQNADDNNTSLNPTDTNEQSVSLNSELDAIRAEKASLSADYSRARTASHRKTALALAAIGVIAVLGGIVFPDVRATLFVIGSVGLFGGVLTWYLTPERVVPIGVSESVYDATTSTLTGIRHELGLQPLTVYVPATDGVRGFIPRHHGFELPDNATHTFVTDDGVSRGLTFSPTGEGLVQEFEHIRTTQASTDATIAVERISRTLIEHFEIVGDVTVDEATKTSLRTISVQDAAFGSVTRVDHPVVSTLACGIVRATGESVIVRSVDDTTVTVQTKPEFDAETAEN